MRSQTSGFEIRQNYGRKKLKTETMWRLAENDEFVYAFNKIYPIPSFWLEYSENYA